MVSDFNKVLFSCTKFSLNEKSALSIGSNNSISSLFCKISAGVPPISLSSAKNSTFGRWLMFLVGLGICGGHFAESITLPGAGPCLASNKRANSKQVSAPLLCPKKINGLSNKGKIFWYNNCTNVGRQPIGASPNRFS